MVRVINFSGGKSSAYMTLMLEPTENDIVLFTDTCREHPKTYEFINNFEKNEGIKIHRAVYEKDGLKGFDALIHSKKYLPNQSQRLCTSELKINTAKRYLRNLGVQKFESYIGFRSDESRRVEKYVQRTKKVVPKFPMYEAGITKKIVNDFWELKPYTLEIPPIFGNCVGCFLKGPHALLQIFEHYPEFAEPWVKDEENDFGKKGSKSTYIKGIRYADILKKSQTQSSIFDQDMQPDDTCNHCHV